MKITLWSKNLSRSYLDSSCEVLVYRNGEKLILPVCKVLIDDLGTTNSVDVSGCRELIPITRIDKDYE